MDGGTLAVIGAVVGALLLGVSALLRQRVASRRRLLRRRDAPPGGARPGLSPAQEAQGAPPGTDRAHRDG